MSVSRRNVLLSTLFGAGYVGLRALATGVPAAVLLKGRRALADGTLAACADRSRAQYVILQTSSLGDPLNAGAPGTYADSGIAHNPDPSMAATPLTVGGTAT